MPRGTKRTPSTKAGNGRKSTVDLETMSLSDLHSLQAEIAQALIGKRQAKVAEAKAKMKRIAGELGMTPEEVVGGRRRRSPGSKVAPKYRNPANAEETWSGRGRRPAWAQALAKANHLETALI